MKKSVSLLLAALFLLCFHQQGIAQTNSLTGDARFGDRGSFSWSVNPFDSKVFIENKGQFDGKDKLNNSLILYGADNEGTQIFFNSRGLTYRFHRAEITNPEEQEQAEKAIQQAIHSCLVNIEFVNANPAAQIVAKNISPGYYNYTQRSLKNAVYHARAYNNLIYKDIYPGIDIECTFHQQQGIKYAFIIHPGANASVIKMKYSGADGVKMDLSGNMLIATEAGDITDHIPVTYYADDKTAIASAFQLDGNIVSFNLAAYDNAKTVVIDPWSVFPSFGGSSNTSRVFNVKTDLSGNIYIYGSYNICKLAKYDSAGNFKWMVNTPYWAWLGGLAPDNAGNVYICGLYGITKYDSAGTLLWDTIHNGIECWRLCFDRTFTHLYTAGSQNASYVYEASIADGHLIDTSNIGGGEEVRAMSVAPNGNIYSIIANSGTLVAADPSLANIYTKSSGGVLLYRPTYGNPPPPSSTTCAENSIATDNNYIYCFDGKILAKINITTGAIITSKSVTGVSTSQLYSGVAVDGCGNIYVGSINKVVEFDSLLNQVKAFTVGGAVYDVTISSQGAIVAGGQDFVAVVGYVPPQCLTSVSVPPPVAGFSSSDSAFCAGGCINFNNLSQNANTYQWLFPGGTPTTSTDVNPQNICYLDSGSYDITLIASNSGGSNTLTLTNHINVISAPPAPNIFKSNDTLFCSYDSAYISYQWYKDTSMIAGETHPFLVISGGGNYNVRVSNANGCKIAVGINIVLGLNDSHTGIDKDIIVFPDPVGNQLLLKANVKQGTGNIIIYNMLGERLMEQQGIIGGSAAINIENLSPGIYFIRLLIADKDSAWEGKFIKE